MIFPKPSNSPDPLPPPSISSDNQHFSLPRIPYFYSITPYPLSPATNSPAGMKRRYIFDSNNEPPSSAPGRGYGGSHEASSAHQGRQQVPSEGADDGFDLLGVDNMIEGRVLKKMRRIKLTSESPPADQPDLFAPQPDPHALSNAIWNTNHDGPSSTAALTLGSMPTQATPSDMPRPFAPIKISTRATSSRQEPAISSPLAPSSASSTTLACNNNQQKEQAKVDSTNQLRAACDGVAQLAVYSGMNSLLHRIHASRFGIPDEVEPPAAEATSAPVQNETSTLVPRIQLQDSFQGFTANPVWHLQQQQQHTRNIATNNAWYQSQQKSALSSTRMMDEDDEMADVNETQSFSPSFPTNGFRFPQEMNGSSVTQQGYVLNQHLANQQQQQQQHSLQQNQAGQTAEEQNLYHTINSQLRAAFLARSEMDKRYR
ncbi:MAG: hypothetical protein J3R72DRAFT_440253 [Linnemannia gamsii]|nr:MAG: hypothetical protein J3R72DRAFT_440253 [Linnemannia gamsii]